ncbi:TrmH family RNA methyltransferase [Candidatus Uhrbacteria bacterium]|nr:TrmH family RNA methyltransferase [Candidatus Uhrbacteria bacterium]
MDLVILAHNIRSAENIGSLFRAADALGVQKVILTGYSPDTDHPKVKKTALGAESAVAHEKSTDILPILDKLKTEEYHILGLELDDRAIMLDDCKPQTQKVALLLGNEVDGIPSYLRDECDELVYIPMHGIKESLNVTIATAITAYQLINNRTRPPLTVIAN